MGTLRIFLSNDEFHNIKQIGSQLPLISQKPKFSDNYHSGHLKLIKIYPICQNSYTSGTLEDLFKPLHHRLAVTMPVSQTCLNSVWEDGDTHHT